MGSSRFISYYNRIFEGVRQNEFVHPKLEKLRDFLIDHFRRNAAADRETRVIVFAQYRSSVQEILNFIRNTPSIHPTAFVGHQKKNGEIMKMAEEGQTEPPSTEQLYEGMKPKPQRSIASLLEVVSSLSPFYNEFKEWECIQNFSEWKNAEATSA